MSESQKEGITDKNRIEWKLKTGFLELGRLALASWLDSVVHKLLNLFRVHVQLIKLHTYIKCISRVPGI